MGQNKWFEAIWWMFIEACGGKCVRCGGVFSCYDKDHIIPRYQGGPETLWNLQPLCAWCNCAKGSESVDRRPKEWQKRFLKILNERLPRELNGG